MPFPDAQYPPDKRVMDAWRLALQAIASDCYRKITNASQSPYESLAMAVWDCATTALRKESA